MNNEQWRFFLIYKGNYNPLIVYCVTSKYVRNNSLAIKAERKNMNMFYLKDFLKKWQLSSTQTTIAKILDILIK